MTLPRAAFAATLLASLFSAACGDVRATPASGASAVIPPSAAAPPDQTDARVSMASIAARRAALREKFLSARTDAARGAIRKEAAAYLERALIDAVLPRWDGTPWAFSGTSTTPGNGSIACGYFVSTTLEEAGLRVERVRLAQQPSEDIIKTLTPSSAIARFSDVPAEKFEAAVAARGDGLYVVGLDIHVGYLVVRGGQVLFHHASYVGPARVVREKAVTSSPLADSRYRVIGKLFTDEALIEAWLLDKPVPTKVRGRAAEGKKPG